MDSFGIGNVLKIVSDFGLVGFIIFLWWTDGKRIMVVIDQGKKDLATILERDAKNLASVLERYQRDMTEQREMYRNNASLCRDFASIATDLRDIVTLNIQTMTQVRDGVLQNHELLLREPVVGSVRFVPKYEPGLERRPKDE